MRRFKTHPYGLTIRPTRLLSLVLMIAVLWVLFGRIKDPATWKVLLDLQDDSSTASAPVPTPAKVHSPETIIPGPNDLDTTAVAEFQPMLELVNDRTALKPREMHAYWRLMKWSRTAPLAELQQRALTDVPFTQLWDQPDKYRGKLISLRLHVRRVLKYEAPSNEQEIAFIYEAWGWTDESRSFPFVVVFPECPDGLPIGTDVRGEVQFVGYFLKVMSYTAFDTSRGAPLLVGRVQVIPSRSVPVATRPNPTAVVWVLLGGSVVAAVVVWTQFRSRSVVRLPAVQDEDSKRFWQTDC